MSLRRLGSVVVILTLLTSCSSGGSSGGSATTERVAASSGLVAATHGFPFANFGASNSPEVMAPARLVASQFQALRELNTDFAFLFKALQPIQRLDRKR